MADRCLICGEEFKPEDKVTEDMWAIGQYPGDPGQPVKVLLHSRHLKEDLEQYKPKMGKWARAYLFGERGWIGISI